MKIHVHVVETIIIMTYIKLTCTLYVYNEMDILQKYTLILDLFVKNNFVTQTANAGSQIGHII